MSTKITYSNAVTDDLVLDVDEFFEGWTVRPSTAQFHSVLRGSFAVELALDGPHVVGFINAISDGVLTAFIPWLEVQPSYRHHGIGSELVRRMLRLLDGMYSVDLTCDPEIQPFYQPFGLVPLAAMARRNPGALASTSS